MSGPCPHPNPPPSAMEEGTYTPSAGFAGGGLRWGQRIETSTRKCVP